jgi:hypothetical protein
MPGLELRMGGVQIAGSSTLGIEVSQVMYLHLARPRFGMHSEPPESSIIHRAMKLIVVSLLCAAMLAAREPPKLSFPRLTFELRTPTLQPFPALLSPFRGAGTPWAPREYCTFGGGALASDPVRTPQDPVRTISDAFRTSTAVNLQLGIECAAEVRLRAPDGPTECRLFGLITESLLPGDEDYHIYNLYFDRLSVDQATEALHFTPDLAVDFSGPSAARVQFDLRHRWALLTTRAHWDFFVVDDVAERALRDLAEECKTWPLYERSGPTASDAEPVLGTDKPPAGGGRAGLPASVTQAEAGRRG